MNTPKQRPPAAAGDPAPEHIHPELAESVIALDSVSAHPRNYNRHEKLAALKESLTVNGQYRRIIVQKSSQHIVAGNGIWLAAQTLGWRRIAADVLDIDDERARRMLLVDNASQSQDFDEEQIIELLAEGELAGTGFTAEQYDEMVQSLADEAALPDEGLTDPDAVPDPPDGVTTTTPGDIWQLGPHYLVCGDSRDPNVLADALAGHTPGLIHADPPYGISSVHADGTIGLSRNHRPVIGDDGKAVAAAAFALARRMYPKAVQVWWGANHYSGAAAIPDSPCWLVWDKVNEGTDFADCELAWTNHQGAVRIHRHQWMGRGKGGEPQVRQHPNQKPVALLAWAMDRLDPERALTHVLEPFAGSGSTLIAAHSTGRIAHLVEIDPWYCDVIRARYAEHTGVQPELLRQGHPAT